MKTLSSHTIIYDNECPMCNLYTGAFVKTGMLDEHGREAYTKIEKCNVTTIDWKRAGNEIALINRTDNSVTYGIDSLITIVGHNIPVLRRVLNIRLIYYFLQKLYLFISYNRKVIAPGKVFEGNNACTPDFNYKYRLVYIAIAWAITSAMLLFYSRLLVPLIPQTNFLREFIICGGQLVFQGGIVLFVRRERTIHYLGNLMTVSLAGGLLLIPAFLFASVIPYSLFYAAYFMIVVALIFFEHMRRVAILELPWFLTATWVLYRIIILSIIL